jgi:hypothetical protein
MRSDSAVLQLALDRAPLLRPRRERKVPARRVLPLTDDLLDLLPHPRHGDAQRLQRLRGHALTLTDEAEQEVLSTDVVVVEHPGLFLRQDNHSTPRSPGRAADPARIRHAGNMAIDPSAHTSRA